MLSELTDAPWFFVMISPDPNLTQLDFVSFLMMYSKKSRDIQSKYVKELDAYSYCPMLEELVPPEAKEAYSVVWYTI